MMWLWIFAESPQLLASGQAFIYLTRICASYISLKDVRMDSAFWDDPDLGIEWPVENPLLSEKDRQLPHLKDVPPEQLPIYKK